VLAETGPILLDFDGGMTISACVVCNKAVLAVEPDQITYPCCDPDDTPLPALSLDRITELIGDQGRCEDCGEPTRGPGFTNRCRPNHKVPT
jgi:hypothetical protein